MKPEFGLLPTLAMLALAAVHPGQAAAGGEAPGLAQPAPRSLAELQRELVNLRFGMFIHFSPATYLDVPDQLQPDHAPPRQGKDGIRGTADDLPASLVQPKKLDTGQWADAAKSAGMKFGVLTTKHHDGFCLWPSRYSDYTVAQGFGRDIVREFVDAFRARGLKVGLYYSIRDRTAEIADARHGGASREKIQLIKNQLSELLTHYGPILYIVFDAWGNTWHESPTFSEISYAEIYSHIKSLQPECLVLNHSRLRSVSDVPQIELRAGMTLPPGGDWPAVGGDTLQEAWFWRKSYPAAELRPVEWIVNRNLVPKNQRNVVFQLNCAPNRDGLMDENVVARLAEAGKAWTPPPALEKIPDSWKNWPVPSSVQLFRGENLARKGTARINAGGVIRPVAEIVDGHPGSSSEITGTNAWWEVDLGKSYPLAGVHLWNRATVKSAMLERGRIFVSEQPFESGDPEKLARQPGVQVIAIDEPPGYPTPYAIGGRGRYIRVVSSSASEMSLAEIEVFAGEQR